MILKLDFPVACRGDFLAQIGPEHAWVNDGDEPCYVLCVLVGIAPTSEVKKMALD